MAGAGYPHLAGQWTDYVAATLKSWKTGTTWGDDAHAQIMPTIVSRLSDADIAALSSYVEGLHSAGAEAAAAK
jgi:cytochrome c553